MDRLLEANRMASLMRRRENPKPLGRTPCNGESDVPRRGSFEFQRLGGRGRVAPAPRAIAAPRAAGWFSTEGPSALPPRARESDPAPTPLEFASAPFNSGRPQTPARRGGVAGAPGLRAAGAARLRRPAPAGKGGHREIGLLRGPVPRLSTGRGAIVFRPMGAASGGYAGYARPLPLAPAAANKGRALRVSAVAGFRLSAPGRRAVRFNPARPERFAIPAAGARHAPPLPRRIPGAPSAATAGQIVVSAEQAIAPFNPVPLTSGLFSASGARGAAPRPADGGTSAPRHVEREWVADVSPAGPSMKASVDARLAAAALFAVPPEASAGLGEHLFAVAPFEPQESFFGLAPRAIQGGMAGLPSLPAHQASTIEEQFAAGLANWIGGVEDWKLDAAGVRTGSLALFEPSIGLGDYDLEFLARLENRGVSWVFRAADFDNYHVCTLAAADDGGYEFARGAVIGGSAESPAVVPVHLTGGSKPTLTVRTRVSGGDFEVSINGEPVARWNDARHPEGGVGFIGSGPDRARLYWVRLSLTERL